MNQRLGIIVATFVSVTVCAVLSYGETHNLGSLPRKRLKAAFLMTVEMESVASDGYQPIYLKFKPRGTRTFARDHRVSVRIAPRHNFVTTLDMAYDCRFTLPQGAGQLDESIYVPYYVPWDTLIVTLLEDGREIDSGKGYFNVNSLRTRDADQKSTVGVVIPRDVDKQDAEWKKCPDVRTLMTVLGDGPLPEDVEVKRLSHQDSLDYLKNVQPSWVQFRPIDESQLHQSWLGYSQLDIIIVAAPLLERIETSQPESFNAIKKWIASGGNLWVYGTITPGNEFISECGLTQVKPQNTIPKKRVQNLLKLGDKNDTSELNYQYYQGVRKTSQDYASRHMLDKMATRSAIFEKMKKAKHPFSGLDSTASIASELTTSNFGLGTVTSIRGDDPFPGSYQFWHSVAGLHGLSQISWQQRNGVKPAQGNMTYWTWLIESVGKPPVKSFILLNTLFVIVIGPLAYFFFRSRERLYLLYFFAPVFALMVTLSLFGYAIFADGTATRLRTRQLSWFDQQNDLATTHSRQTYYAVFGSGNGLDMPDDVAIFPVLHSPAVQRYTYHQGDFSPSAVLSVSPKLQNLSGSFLPARNQVQYATIHPDSISGKISIDWEAETPTISNQLEIALHQIAIRDKDGQYWKAQSISAESTATLAKGSVSSVDAIISKRVVPDPTEAPMLSANRNAAVNRSVSLLEEKLMSWQSRMPTSHFIASADLIVDELGVKDATIKDSVHVIMGELP